MRFTHLDSAMSNSGEGNSTKTSTSQSPSSKPALRKSTAEAASRGFWQGEIELRGLSARPYRILDYVNNEDYGTVSGPAARLTVQFQDHLLLQATPEATSAQNSPR